MRIAILWVIAATLIAPALAIAKGGHGKAVPGTGSSQSSTHVHGYTKKDGTYVAPHEKSKADDKFENNWSTKGNENPRTGKEGTQVNKPKGK